MLIVRISTLSQCPIIDVATTSEGLRQYVFLFIAWVEAILVGLLLFHTLQYSTYAVKCQTVSLPITSRKERPFYPHGWKPDSYPHLFEVARQASRYRWDCETVKDCIGLRGCFTESNCKMWVKDRARSQGLYGPA